jgi:hypothetical protein
MYLTWRRCNMTNFPLLFGFRDVVAGKGYFAGVTLDGRALLADEDDGFWMYGVNPGGIAAGGESHAEAQAAFRQSYRTVLFDIASEAGSFDEFKSEVERFFKETNEPTLADWTDAVDQVRSGKVDADWLAKRSAESKVEVRVELLEQAVPSANALDEADLAA